MNRVKIVFALWLAAGLLGSGVVAAGSVVLVGGGLARDDREAHRQIFKRRDFRRPLCIIASAHPNPIRAMNAKVKDFERHMGAKGPRFVLGLPLTLESAKATNPAVVNTFARCGGFFFTDGDARRIHEVLIPDGELSATATLMRRAFEKGALVAGTGAGAAAVAELVAIGGSSAEALRHGIAPSSSAPGVKFHEGASIWRGVFIQPKALVDGHFGRVLVAARAAEQRLGFAIDVGTALIVDDVHGDKPLAKVLGKSQVIVVDAGDGDTPDRFFLLGDGDGFDLAAREAIPEKSRQPQSTAGTVSPLEDPWRGDAFHRGLLAFAVTPEVTWTVGKGEGALEIHKAEDFRVFGPAPHFAGPFEIR